jgi:hypothetical protein
VLALRRHEFGEGFSVGGGGRIDLRFGCLGNERNSSESNSGSGKEIRPAAQVDQHTFGLACADQGARRAEERPEFGSVARLEEI